MIRPDDFYTYFTFKCFNCNEEFNIHLGYMLGKETIICPNCNQNLDNDVVIHLKEAVNNLEKSLIKLNSLNSPNKGWRISLFWSKNNMLPGRPDKSQHAIDKDNKDSNNYKPFPPPKNDGFIF